MTIHDFVQVQAITNLAEFDTGIAIWKEKRKHNAVRPFSAIKFIWGN